MKVNGRWLNRDVDSHLIDGTGIRCQEPSGCKQLTQEKTEEKQIYSI